MNRTTIAALVFLLAGAACQRSVELETRTFRLEHIGGGEASSLIEPYVFRGREGAPGELSATNAAVTVRETPDNLERIEQMLAEHDRANPDVRLHFQLIEADGFTGTDPAIADVVAELEKVFRFGGYRLAGEAFVAATNGSDIEQRLEASDVQYLIEGHVYQLQPGTIRLDEVLLFGEEGRLLGTTVNVRAGQTLVLGSSPKPGSAITLLLTVRAEEVRASG